MKPAALLLGLVLLTTGSAAAQIAGPTTEGPPAAPSFGPAPRRIELGIVYGLAVFTERHGGAVWYADAPTSGAMDLQTSPALGAGGPWAATGNLRLGARVTRQAPRLEVTDAEGATTRTDLVLLHCHLELEKTFGGGSARPLLALSGGGVRAQAEDGSGDQWHYSAAAGVGARFAVDPRLALRLQARVPLIWANGDLVVQLEPALGAAFLF